MKISGCRFDTLRFDFRLLFLQISFFSEVKICYFQIILQFVKYFFCAIDRLLWNKTLPYNFARSFLFSFWTNHLNFHNNVALVNARQYLLVLSQPYLEVVSILFRFRVQSSSFYFIFVATTHAQVAILPACAWRMCSLFKDTQKFLPFCLILFLKLTILYFRRHHLRLRYPKRCAIF